MRAAALYDIHGNLPALQAVLAAIGDDIDAVVVGGDIASGPMPTETLDRLIGLGPRVQFLRGNADRELVTAYDGAAVRDDDDVWRQRAAWSASRLASNYRDLLADLPEHVILDIDDLGEVFFCHGSPRSDEEIITERSSEERLEKILADVSQHVVVCGHTHMQFDRRVGGTRLVNAGSVGMPYEGRPGAYWCRLGPNIELRRTAYDFDAAAEAIRRSGYPAAEEHLADLFLRPPSREEATAFFEEQWNQRT